MRGFFGAESDHGGEIIGMVLHGFSIDLAGAEVANVGNSTFTVLSGVYLVNSVRQGVYMEIGSMAVVPVPATAIERSVCVV